MNLVQTLISWNFFSRYIIRLFLFVTILFYSLQTSFSLTFTKKIAFLSELRTEELMKFVINSHSKTASGRLPFCSPSFTNLTWDTNPDIWDTNPDIWDTIRTHSDIGTPMSKNKSLLVKLFVYG